MKKLHWLHDEEKVNRNSLIQIAQNSICEQSKGEISTVYLFLTRKCNLGCAHCYINGVGPKAKDFDFNLEKIMSILLQAKLLGVKKVKVSGGEPFVHKEIMEILNFLQNLELDEIVLETNGTLIDKEDFKKLSAIKNLTIYVSLDHFNEMIHDKFRRKDGAFKKTTYFLKELGASSINSVVTTTAYKGNYLQILEIINFVSLMGIKRHRTLLNIHPLGNALDNLSDGLNLEECIVIIDSIVTSIYYQSGFAYLTLPPALTPIEDINKIKTCGWGESVLGVLSTGDISMCSASYDDVNMIAGNLNDNSLEQIWRGSFFKSLKEIGDGAVKGVCGNCLLYSVCRGVCRMSSYAHYSEIDAPYPLCQEFYNNGLFPNYALVDATCDSTYKASNHKSNRLVSNFPNTFKALAELTSKT